MCEAAGEADQLLEAELLGPAHEVGAELPRAARHEAGPVNTKVQQQIETFPVAKYFVLSAPEPDNCPW